MTGKEKGAITLVVATIANAAAKKIVEKGVVACFKLYTEGGVKKDITLKLDHSSYQKLLEKAQSIKGKVN